MTTLDLLRPMSLILISHRRDPDTIGSGRTDAGNPDILVVQTNPESLLGIRGVHPSRAFLNYGA